MAQPANPLRYDEVAMDMEVAVYIPGLSRPLYGSVVGKWSQTKPTKERVNVLVWRKGQSRVIEVDLAQIVPW